MCELHDPIREKSAYIEGSEAYLEGRKINACPYHKLSENGASWIRGWSTARYFHLMSMN